MRERQQLLLAMLRYAPMTPKEIAEHRAEYTLSMVYKALQDAEKKGLVERVGELRVLTNAGWHLVGPRDLHPNRGTNDRTRAVLWLFAMALSLGAVLGYWAGYSGAMLWMIG